MKLNLKEKKVLSIFLGIYGISLIITSLIMNNYLQPIIQNKYSIKITNKKVTGFKTNEIKLKDIEKEINTPLSVNIKDYLDGIDKIDESIINAMKLDTSQVNVTQAGKYTYIITYKKKKYSAYITIKEKELPKLDIELKNLRYEKNTNLPTNLENYINTTLTDEVKNNIKLDLSEVKIDQIGTYKYTVTYNKTMYTADIEIYEKKEEQVNEQNNNEEKKDEKKEEDIIVSPIPNEEN